MSDSRDITRGDNFSDQDVAVIGMAGRFPGARNLQQHWTNLCEGVEPITFYSKRQLKQRGIHAEIVDQPDYVPAASVLEDADLFDASFFGYSPTEAELMDPQGRVFLECAWEALESAAYNTSNYSGSVGVYASQSLNTYLLRNVAPSLDFDDFILSGRNLQAVVANGIDFLCTRVSYKLNLRGPSVTVQSACSSSLVALHMARQAVLAGECDMALAGGVSIYLPQQAGYQYRDGMILSPDGHCRPFDARAGGTVFGRGVGVVVLKPLDEAMADGDHIHAVIRGTAVNNDGSNKIGFTAPSIQGQAQVVAEALANADIAPESIGYIEAHGTGTPQGDPIEIAALKEAFPKPFNGAPYCGLGTLKSNLGHLDAAAGVAGFIKAVMMVEHGKMPPCLHFETPNPQIDFRDSAFYVNDVLREWRPQSGPRRAGISSFGIGGTNAHVILEEAPPRSASKASNRPAHILSLSARSESAVQELARRYDQHLTSTSGLSPIDVCFTTNVGRRHFDHRATVVGEDLQQLLDGLRELTAGKPSSRAIAGHAQADRQGVAFLFTGQGAQREEMGRELFETEPRFRATLERCDEILRPLLDTPLLSVLYGTQEQQSLLHQTAYTQPALFALEYALAELWRSWGVRPDAVMGHSVGEYTAACVAGVFSLEDGLTLIAERGRLLQSLPRDGAMAAVAADESTVTGFLDGHESDLSIAAINSPTNTVISGRDTTVDQLLNQLRSAGIASQRLQVSHAFHSPLIEPILDDFHAAAARIDYQRPQIDLISNTTGNWLTTQIDAQYWRRHAREAVRFAQGFERFLRQGQRLFVEVGPHPVLLGMARQSAEIDEASWLPSLRRGHGDWQQMLASLGSLYVSGADVDWDALNDGRLGRRLPLPTYPFERQRYWLDEPDQPSNPPRDRTTQSLTTRRDGKSIDGAHPLVGHRIASPLPDIQFQTELSCEALPFLSDHAVHGTMIFPATAYIEMALSAATEVLGTEQLVMKDVELLDALVVPPEGTYAAQLVMSHQGSEASFHIYGAPSVESAESVDWIVHARGKVAVDGTESTQTKTSLDEITDRCGEVLSGEQFYRRVRANGFEYGPAFRGIQTIRRRDGEAVAQIECPERMSDERLSSRVHPAHLDAGLQLIFAANASWSDANSDTLLPVRIDQMKLHADLPQSFTSHVRLRQDARSENLTADVRLFAENGALIAEFGGIELRAAPRSLLEQARRDEVNSWLHHVAWQPCPLTSPRQSATDWLPSVDALTETIRRRYADVVRSEGVTVYDDLGPELDELSTDFVLQALTRLGFTPTHQKPQTLDDVARATAVKATFRPLLRRALEFLVEDGIVQRLDNDLYRFEPLRTRSDPDQRIEHLLSRYSSCSAELRMLSRCGGSLADVLTGRCDPMSLLFPNGSIRDLESLYTDAPFTRAYNCLVRDAVEQIVTTLPDNVTLRVLEVGAGTGGTARWVLPALAGHQVEYTFTDVSPLFLARAEEKFGEFPFVDYKLLDVGRDALDQSFSPESFDLVLATNVLHATADLRQTVRNVRTLLAPGGSLIAVEGVSRQRWVDLIFGLTEGWWLFNDKALRQDYPLISRSAWLELLTNTDFETVDVVPSLDRNELFGQAILVADSHAVDPAADSSPRRWIIFADDGGIGEALRHSLEQSGDLCVSVVMGDHFEFETETRRGSVSARSRKDFARLLREAGRAVDGILFLWPLDDRPTDRMNLNDVQVRCETTCAAALNLVQALTDDASSGDDAARLWLVTRGAQAIGPLQSPLSVVSSPLWGFGRCVTFEYPELQCVKVDLDPFGGNPVAELTAELRMGTADDQVGYREATRFVARITPGSGSDRSLQTQRRELPQQDFRLETRAAGVLENLEFVPVPRCAPDRNEVQIKVHATGLNFVDVLTALGTGPVDPRPFGAECAGIVTAVGEDVTDLSVGDRVMALTAGSFGRHVNANAALVAPIGTLSYEDAATIPSVFMTVWHAFEHGGGPGPGETILIHAGAGGVGMAAIALAKRAGATIYATAGSDRKRELLRSLGVEAVFDSRSTSFAKELLKSTHGRRVDVVLNSLAGEFIDKSFEVLPDDGRFLELGKRDVRSEEEVAAVRPNVRYSRYDLQALAEKQPESLASEFRTLAELFTNGALRPLPRTIFPLEYVVDAFRFMMEARHVGKVVISQHQELSSCHAAIRPDASYLITGGAGGLGLLVTEWLVEQGARSIVLIGRTLPSAAARSTFAELERSGARITFEQIDVADRDAMGELFQRIAEGGLPLKGVFHAAGTLHDGLLAQQTWDRFRTVMAAKIDGSWILHELTRDLSLDFFLLFSSVAALLGFRGQANHAAANAFLDSLANHRRAIGLPATSINWGAWGEVGAAADRGLIAQLAERGLGSVSNRGGIQLVARSLDVTAPSLGHCANIVALPIDWNRFLQQYFGRPPACFETLGQVREATADNGASEPSEPVSFSVRDELADATPSQRLRILQDYLQNRIMEKLKLDRSKRIDPNQALSELGLDSLLAVELRGVFASDLGLQRALPSTLLFDYPTLAAVSRYLGTHELGMELAPVKSTADSLDDDGICDQTEEDILALSEEAAEQLLMTELDGSSNHDEKDIS